MTQHTSQTRKTAPQRTARLRRILGTAAVALVGLLGLPQAADAQTRGQRADGDRVERHLAELDQALDLSDRQAAQLRALFEAQEADRPARGERRSGSPDDPSAPAASTSDGGNGTCSHGGVPHEPAPLSR